MTKKKSGLSLRMRAVILLSALIILIAGFVSHVLITQSGEGMRTLINERMLDISNTAAAMLDGDALDGMTEEDLNSPDFRSAMDTLRTFYENIELEYIYCVYDRGNGRYVFGIDPSDDPGNFNDPVVSTPALAAAFEGIRGVDLEAYEDEWGIFYSAYSPVFNSKGEVACVVAADFDANWYNNRLAWQRWTVLGMMLLALLVGIAVMLLITGQLRRKLLQINQEAKALGDETEQLARQISLPDAEGGFPDSAAAPGEARENDIEAIRLRLHSTQDRLRKYIAHTQDQARKDAMTGVGNRNAYRERVAELNREIERGDAAFAIGIFDVNNLKHINDLCGHEAGDGIIMQAAQAVTEVYGSENTYRIGGDEFIAILNGTDEAGISRMNAQLREVIVRLNRNPAHPEAELSLSRGFAVYDPKRDGEFLSLFRRADQDMYANKESFYRSEDVRRKLSDGSASAARNRARMRYIADHLEEALQNGRISAWIQPIVRLVNNRVCAEEALARWEDPEWGMISPAEFIPALEDARLAYKLDLYMVEEATRLLRRKMEIGFPLVPISVNFSRTDFDACDMVQEITDRVDRAGVSRDLIRIEITESVIGSDFDFMKRQIERFEEKGFRVWMDDFGSGFSSLDVLQSVHFDTIKLDMRFMRQFDGSDRTRIILTELISMAMNLGVNTIVEGVETEEQVKFLQEIGASKVQGYFFSPPLTQDAIWERHASGNIRIGLENPGETDYYNSISRMNLQDPSMVTKTAELEEDYSSYFRTLPMAIIEAGPEEAVIIRANRSYREFLKRFMNFEMEEGQQVVMPLSSPDVQGPFIDAVLRRREEGGWEKIQEVMPNGEMVHAFFRQIAENPVTGKTAVALIVLAVI